MKNRTFIFILLFSFSTEINAQQTNDLFFYIPDNEAMSYYLHLHSYLKSLEQNEDDYQTLLSLLDNYLGQNSLQSLFFESFLRYTKNKNIQNEVLDYLSKNNINTNFSNNLRKLYASDPITTKRRSDGLEILRYSYNDSEFDENINLFHFREVGLFDNEIGMLLFNNDWNTLSFDNPINENIEWFFIACGGQTNALTISFRKYSNITEDETESIYYASAYTQKYQENWKVTTLPLEGVLNRAGADSVTIAYGLGPDAYVNIIETGTFNAYLYNKKNNMMYEISYFMNFSPININYSERNRMFNLLLFQLLFVFIN